MRIERASVEIIVICIAALIASALTLFSGFGLGTLLMPVVAIFFPIELAVAMTAIVHLANNLFKFVLFRRKANASVLMSFGLPAIAAALVGAGVLAWLGELKPVFEYNLLGHDLQVSPLKLVIGILIIAFVALELSTLLSNISLPRKWLSVGGLLSGFFGGLSGHQGAFRTLFLLKAGLDKETFVATGVVLAVMVDVSRLAIYGDDILVNGGSVEWSLVIPASVAAFVGAYFGSKLLKKVTIRSVQIVVSILLVMVAAGLIAGVL